MSIDYTTVLSQILFFRWNLGVSAFQRFKDDVFSLFITCLLIWASYTFALYVSSRDEDYEKEVPPKHPQYGKALGFAIWGQVYNQMCTNTFGWLASQLNNHDHDAAQLNLLLRYTLLKCVNSIMYIVVTPRASTLTLRSVSAMKMMLYADAVIGPMLRYIDIFSFIKRFFSRWLPNQPLMDWAHLVRPPSLRAPFLASSLMLILFSYSNLCLCGMILL